MLITSRTGGGGGGGEEGAGSRGIILYREYQSVCSFVRIGSAHPHLPPASVCPLPRGTKGEGQHSLAGEEAGGANSDDWRESLALCLLCGAGSLRRLLKSRMV